MATDSILSDFSIWLNPANLKSFKKLEVLKLGAKLARSKTQLISDDIQSKLAIGLENTPGGRADFTLRIYFYQLLNGDKFSIDLRKSNFNFIGDNWFYNGTRIAHEFERPFMESLVETYEVYYIRTGASLKGALTKMGLIKPAWNEEQANGLEELFLSHFNQANSVGQKFKVSELLESFAEIFLYLRNNGAIVPTEFAALGIYLTSLYMNLENADVSVDVKECFNYTRNIFSEVND